MKFKNKIVRSVASTVAVVFLLQTVLSSKVEANFWQERRSVATAQRKAGTPTLLASLPGAPSPLALFGSNLPTGTSNARIPARMGDVRSVPLEQQKTSVVLIQDAHRVESAQVNIAEILEHLNTTSGPLVVGVEGAAGSFNLQDFRQWANDAERDAVSAYMVRRGLVNGAELFGMKTAQEPLLWGVESPELYHKNVKALQESLAHQKEIKSVLTVWDKELQPLRQQFFSSKALAWDAAVTAYHQEKMGLVDYVQTLAKLTPGPLPTETSKLIRVATLEKELNMLAMEKERRDFLETLSGRLTPEAMASLMKDSASYRLGDMSGTAYYETWKTLATAHGLSWKNWPQMDRYVSSVILSEKISAQKLFDELALLHDQGIQSIGRTPQEREVLALSEDLRLMDRLVSLTLVPSEWNTCSTRRENLLSWPERFAKIQGRVSPLISPIVLNSYFVFYETALERNDVMATNLLKKAQEAGAKTAVLVAGGFHTEGLLTVLASRGASPMVVAPKIGEIVAGTSYMDAFTVKRTPVERMLLGERLDLAPPASLATQSLGELANLAKRLMGLAQTAARLTETTGDDIASPAGTEISNVRRQGDTVTADVTVEKVASKIVVEPAEEETPTPPTDTEVITLPLEAGAVTATVTPRQNSRTQGFIVGILTRFTPELIVAGIFWLLGIGDLSVSTAGFAVAVSAFVRAGWTGSILWHGFGHVVALQGARPGQWGAPLKKYMKGLGFSILPFTKTFIPGLSARPPTLDLPGKLSPSRTRWVAAMGPVFSLVGVGVSAVFLWTGISLPLEGWEPLFVTLLSMNVVHLLTSWSDLGAIFSGKATRLNCGLIIFASHGKVERNDQADKDVREALVKATYRTATAGGQRVGMGQVRVNIGHEGLSLEIEKTERGKDGVGEHRNEIVQMAEEMLETQHQQTQRAGVETLDSIEVHVRLATSEGTDAHPFLSQEVRTPIVRLRDPNEGPLGRHWIESFNPKGVGVQVEAVQTKILANGDDNNTENYNNPNGTSVIISNSDDALLSKHMTGFVNPASGVDSAQIATRVQRWITQGNPSASLQLAMHLTGMRYLTDRGLKTDLDDILSVTPTQATIENIERMPLLRGFVHELKDLHADVLYQRTGLGGIENASALPDPKTLEELFMFYGARIKRHEVVDLETPVEYEENSYIENFRNNQYDKAKNAMNEMPWFRDLTEGEQQLYLDYMTDLFLKFFFTGDLYRAGVHLLRRSDSSSTYGLSVSSLSEPTNRLFAKRDQPLYLWVTEKGRLFVSTSNIAFMGAVIDGDPVRYRRLMKENEVAYLQGSSLYTRNAEKGSTEVVYDLRRPDSLSTFFGEAKWEDLKKTPPKGTQDRYAKLDPNESTDPSTEVERDVALIPHVNEALRKSFEKPEAKTKKEMETKEYKKLVPENRQAGDAFVDMLIERMNSRKGKSQKIRTGVDLVIVGAEKSLTAGKAFKAMIDQLSSMAGRPLSIKLVDVPEFDEDRLQDLARDGFDENTLILAISHSAQTANTIYTVRSLHQAQQFRREQSGKSASSEGTVFAVNGNADNGLAEIIGQELAAGTPFLERNFVTFPGMSSFHPSVASTVTYTAEEKLLKELSFLFAKGLSEKRWVGNKLRALAVINAVRRMVDNGDEFARMIIGVDALGHKYVTSKDGTINSMPMKIQGFVDKLKVFFLETFWVMTAGTLFVVVTLAIHQTPGSLLLMWFPNQVFVFSQGIPLVALVIGIGVALLIANRLKMWRYRGLDSLVKSLIFWGQINQPAV